MLDYVIIEARRQPQNEVVLTKRIARNQRFSVGRTDSADLVMNDDPEISSIHFLVAVSDDECTVTDQDSTNKTWYNGQPITQISIGDGERILCGKTEFTFRLVAAFDDQFSAKLFVKDQPWAESRNKSEPARDLEVETNSQADRTTGVKPVSAAIPAQLPQRKPAPTAIIAPSTARPTPPVVPSPSSTDPVPAKATDSGDLINWNLFAEQEPVTGKVTKAEVPVRKTLHHKDSDPPMPSLPIADGWEARENTSDAEKTQVLIGQTPTGTIVRVMIGIAGQTSDSFRAVIDPNQRPKVVIGRAASTYLVCPLDPFMSNQHFAVEIQGSQCTIKDLETSNGTWLNGQRILIAPLRHGDHVCAGKTDFEIAIETRP